MKLFFFITFGYLTISPGIPFTLTYVWWSGDLIVTIYTFCKNIYFWRFYISWHFHHQSGNSFYSQLSAMKCSESIHIGNNLENNEIYVAWQENTVMKDLTGKKVLYMSQQKKPHRGDWFIWQNFFLQGLVKYKEIDVAWQGNIHVKLSINFPITCKNIL